MNTADASAPRDQWHKHDFTGIQYRVVDGRSVERVVFDRLNVAAGVMERVSIHWTQVAQWADADPCGGLGLRAVILSDGREGFASGRWFNPRHPDSQGQHGLCAVHVGCYGDSWLRIPLRAEAAKVAA